MLILFYLLPLIFFIASTICFNKKKLLMPKKQFIYHSTVDVLSSFSIVSILFLQGVYGVSWLYFINVLIIVASLALLLYAHKVGDSDADLIVETVKNNLLLFLRTLLPLFVFMTIFRFTAFYIQLPLSIGLSIVVFIAAHYLTKITSVWSEIVKRKMDSMTDMPYVFGIIIVLFIFVVIAFVQVPSSVETSLNLKDHDGYARFQLVDNDALNNIVTKEIITIDTGNYLSEIEDYYYNDDYFYYIVNHRLIVYDRNAKEEIGKKDLFKDGQNELIDDLGTDYSQFILLNNDLVIATEYGAFIVNNDSTVQVIPETEDMKTSVYKENEKYYLLVETEEGYTLINDLGQSTLIEEDVTLTVISDTLFIVEGSLYTTYYNDSISFDINSTPTGLFETNRLTDIAYDPILMTMYTIDSGTKNESPRLIKISKDSTKEEVSIKSSDEIRLYVLNSTLYLIEDNRVLGKLDSNMELESFYISPDKIRVLISIIDKESVNLRTMKSIDGSIEISTVNHFAKEARITISEIHEEDLDIALGFYSYYGITSIIVIIFAMFIPMTNYRSFTTVIDFETQVIEKGKKTIKTDD